MRTRSLTAGLILTLLFGLLSALPAVAQEPAAEVDVVDNDFAPNEVTIQPGDTVRWTWTGQAPHTVTSTDGSFEGSPTQTEGTFDVTFPDPGTYSYICTIHSNQSGTVRVAGEAQPPTDTSTDTELPSVSGDDPAETALAYSGTLPDGSTANALIGTSATFPDSLASGSLQGAFGAPLLLTDGMDLDDRVVAELDRLQVDDVTILGGTDAVSDAVEQELASLVARVGRVGGSTRLGTALAVADLFKADGPAVESVIIARAFGSEGAALSQEFADALGAGAASASAGTPVILTRTESLDPGVATWLTENGVQNAIIAGGTAAISAETEAAVAALGIATTRLGGNNRASTAALIGGPLVLDGTTTVVQGEGDLAWASGFAAALTSPGGVLLTQGEVAPADTLNAILGVPSVRCGPTLSDEICGQIRSASDVDPEVPAQLIAVLDGDQEVPPNESGASGQVAIHAAGRESICLLVTTNGLTGPIQMSHLHEGAFGVNGDVSIPFTTAPSDLIPGSRTGCLSSVEMGALSRLFAVPEGFYANIHTEANPGGEIRGQVFAPEGATTAVLEGAQEVPGPGDPVSQGLAVVWDTGVPGELCYTVTVVGLDLTATASHIHRGVEGAAGDVVVQLDLGGADPNFAHCDRGLEEALVDEILSQPNGFYVNVHNETYPAGAIRGNLFEASRD